MVINTDNWAYQLSKTMLLSETKLSVTSDSTEIDVSNREVSAGEAIYIIATLLLEECWVMKCSLGNHYYDNLAAQAIELRKYEYLIKCTNSDIARYYQKQELKEFDQDYIALFIESQASTESKTPEIIIEDPEGSNAESQASAKNEIPKIIIEDPEGSNAESQASTESKTPEIIIEDPEGSNAESQASAKNEIPKIIIKDPKGSKAACLKSCTIL
jgi:hypothetical protein